MVTNGLLLCDMNHFILVIGILEPNASASQARRRDSPVKGFTFAQSVVCTQYSFKKKLTMCLRYIRDDSNASGLLGTGCVTPAAAHVRRR
jgi:hypothetical protein